MSILEKDVIKELENIHDGYCNNHECIQRICIEAIKEINELRTINDNMSKNVEQMFKNGQSILAELLIQILENYKI